MMERMMNRLNMYPAQKTSSLQKILYEEKELRQHERNILGKFLLRYAYSHLSTLLEKKIPVQSTPVSHPLSIEELEMLEAELINQGILTPDVDALSKRVRREISLLLWNAKRTGASTGEINFKIDLMSFIVFEVNKLCPDELCSHHNTHPLRQKMKNELRYLDQFASYLTGAFEEPRSGYEKGLNVVLKAIMKTHETEKTHTPDIIMPISKQEFMKKITTNSAELINQMETY
jgi:hypothetical protein